MKYFGVKKFDGLTLDLGLSSSQIFTSSRGFSFSLDGPLDMRMTKEKNGVTAKKIINEFSEKQLAEIFYYYGEEKIQKIAKSIILERKKKLKLH